MLTQRRKSAKKTPIPSTWGVEGSPSDRTAPPPCFGGPPPRRLFASGRPQRVHWTSGKERVLRPLAQAPPSNMSTSATLQELARQVRLGTLQILDAAPPAWLTYAPPGTSNHMLWHAGHVLWLQDALCIELLTGRSELPRGWANTFGMNCRPVELTREWPGRSELADLLRQQLDRMLELLSSTDEQQLASPANPARGPAAVAERIIHGLHDEAKHSGEMYLLWKLCQADSA